MTAWVEIVLLAVAIAISVLAFRVSIAQSREQQRSSELQALFHLHQYLSQAEFADARRRVRKEMHLIPYESWGDEDRTAADRVCASYDQAGILFEFGIISSRDQEMFLRSSWGCSVCDQFDVLDPYLSDVQAVSRAGSRFFVHFANLNEEARNYHR